jgi:hypothetical protein
MKTYAKKFNAQRAARAELGDDAIEGIDYRVAKAKDGWAWEQGRKPATPEPADETYSVDEAIDVAIKRGTSKRAAIEEAARGGMLPEPPDFSAQTHARFRNKLAHLVELAKAGDIKGLKAITINPVSSSPKAMARYRDFCLIALESRK